MGVADEVMKRARQLAPYRTGNLRRSINVVDINERDVKVTVAALASYSGWVEYGTSKMQAQPYLRPAILQVVHEWPSRFVNKMVRLAK